MGNAERAKGGGGALLRLVELLRLVLRFSSGAEEVGGRGDEAAGVSEALAEPESGLLGAAFRLVLCRDPEAAAGDPTAARALCSAAFSRSFPPAVGLRGPQL